MTSSNAVMDEVHRSFTLVKVARLQYKNTLLQVKVLHSNIAQVKVSESKYT